MIQNWKQISQKYLDADAEYRATVIHPVDRPKLSILINIYRKQKIVSCSHSSNISCDSSIQSQIDENDEQMHVPFLTKMTNCIKLTIIRLLIFVLVISVIIQFDYTGVLTTHHYHAMHSQYATNLTYTPDHIKHIILKYANNPDQFHAITQTYQAVSNISNCTNKQSCATAYRQIVRSIQCNHFINSHTHQHIYREIQQILLDTIDKIDRYFQMLEHFNGEAFKLNQLHLFASACQFQLRQNYNISSNTTHRSENTSVVINIQTIAYGPLHLFKNILSLITSLKSQNKYDIVNFIVKKTQQPKGFYKNTIRNFYKTTKYKQFTQIQLYTHFILCIQNFEIPKTNKDSTQNKLVQSLKLFFKQTVIDDEIKDKVKYDIGKTKDFIVQQIQEGSKVMITAYSQSTIVTNTIYDAMTSGQKQNIGLVYISPLVDKIPDQKGQYIYSESDQTSLNLTDYVKQNGYVSNPLQPNQPKIQNCTNCKGSLNKIIEEIQEIIQNVTNNIQNQLTKPAKYLGKGNITVQLKWDTQPDVDLHIWEPSGTHVYYSHKGGLCGYLDRDDTDGEGPQHYFTSSENFTLGTYIFKLNYYRGSLATKVIVTVSAGPQHFTKQLTLHPALGSNGNNNPSYHICSVEASQNKKGFNSFKIIP